MHIILKISLSFFLCILMPLSMAEGQNSPQTPTESAATDTQAVNAQTNGTNKSEPEVETEQAPAEPKQYYIVEVILFKHLNEEGKRDEFWHHPDSVDESTDTFSTPLPAAPSLTDDTPALAEYDLINRRFLPLRNGVAALSSSNYKLADSAAHLRYSKDFELLAHFGWTQRSLSKRQALPILINANQFSDSQLPSGHLKLYVSRYLHMQVDLSTSSCEPGLMAAIVQKEMIDDKQLDKQLEDGTSALEKPAAGLTSANTNSPQGNMSQQPACVTNTYLFKQQRKMRSKELHYLDNPIYGLLVYVTPFLVDANETTNNEVTEAL